MVAACALALAMLGGTLGALALPPAAAAEESQECQAEKFIYGLTAYAIGHEMQPESGTEVGQHTPVTLTAEAEWPLHFEVASSEEALAAGNDIASGNGTSGPGSSTTKWSYSSPRLTSEGGTVYWQVSFTRELKACNHEQERFTTSESFGGAGGKPNALTVLSLAEKIEPPPPSCSASAPAGASTTWSAPTAACMRLGLTAAKSLRLGRTLSYLVSCTAGCAGQTSVRATLVQRHKRPRKLSSLNIGARKVSIAASTGGHQRFPLSYRARTLRSLKRMLRGGGEVQLSVSVKVTDAAGKPAQASRTIRLHR